MKATDSGELDRIVAEAATLLHNGIKAIANRR